jgi:hypothetical protein|tara:strand:- start:825 stop:935 length:111 start_codon:yes stop_codon:yes gene_type:complete
VDDESDGEDEFDDDLLVTELVPETDEEVFPDALDFI